MSRNILQELYARKAERLAEIMKARPIAEMRARAEAQSFPVRRSLIEACRRRDRLNVIAEIKSASPSKGVIRPIDSHDTIARDYERGGAAAISVLTEEDFFHGSLASLEGVSRSVGLPVLRKDFLFDPYQVYESRAAGADGLLLIVAMLDRVRLKELIDLTQDSGLEPMVEVHDQQEMDVALAAGATLVGVNNRNLVTFEVSLDVSRRLAPMATPDITLVSESGLRDRGELLELRALGYHAFLIGEHLMREAEPGAALQALIHDGPD